MTAQNSAKQIYFDHAATTPVDPLVLEAMLPYFSEEYGNAESLHSKGQNARIALDNSRATIAKILNCHSNKIVFTSGGTESNNLAIFGVARGLAGHATTAKSSPQNKGRHLITSAIEHASVSEAFNQLEKEGFEVTRLKVDQQGFIDPEELRAAIRPNTILVSIMYANNEIGTIEPIEKIGQICREKNIIFHCDACQAAGVLSLDVRELNVDLMTINGSKIYGPKGIGALFIRKNIKIEPLIFGGNQENGMRGGTQNIPGIVGLAKALELAQENRENENSRLTKLRNKLIEGILKKVPGAQLNGPNSVTTLDNIQATKTPSPYYNMHPPRLPNNCNFTIKNVVGQDLLLQLDEAGIYVSTGAACQVRTSKPSNVLRAIGVPMDQIENNIRLTLGKQTTAADIDHVLEVLPELVKKIRERG